MKKNCNTNCVKTNTNHGHNICIVCVCKIVVLDRYFSFENQTTSGCGTNSNEILVLSSIS